MPLAATFLGHLAVPWRADEAALERELAALIAAGRDAWPGVVVPDDELVRHVAARFPGEGSLAELHAADLYLACACARGDARALTALDRRFFAELRPALARVSDDTDELLQRLRTRLLVAEPGAQPRIAGYTGAGPLGGWLRVAAVRLALSMHREHKAQREVAAEDILFDAPSDAPGPEQALRRAEARAAFRAAFADAFRALAPRERNLLRMYHVDGLTVEELGSLHKVHFSTISRWIQKARDGLWQGTRGHLAAALRIAPEDVDSVLGLVPTRLDVSLHSLLRTAAT